MWPETSSSRVLALITVEGTAIVASEPVELTGTARTISELFDLAEKIATELSKGDEKSIASRDLDPAAASRP